MEREQWYAMVFEAIQEIPPGKVTSYGHIARLLGRRECVYFLINLADPPQPNAQGNA
jgi:methylated-DNA-protein-cysteine methyltransferase-like protein